MNTGHIQPNKIGIVAIGAELLSGKTTDTNSSYIAQTLYPQGIRIHSVRIVDDVVEEICGAIQESLKECSYVLCTGGLGPTKDDLTRHAIAKVAGVELVENPASLSRLEAYLEKRGRRMTETNRRQVSFPQNAQIIENTRGTADAFETPIDGGRYICAFPGVPSEMKLLLTEFLVPRLASVFPQREIPETISFRLFGIAESDLGMLIESLDLQDELQVSYRPQFPEILLEVRIFGATCTTALHAAEELLTEKLAPHIISRDPQSSMIEEVSALLRTAGKTLALAESCSGGLLAAMLIRLPGASAFLESSIVSYSNKAKQEILGVRKETLDTYGAVSIECAKEMAECARRLNHTDFALSISGIAGPDGGTDEKPVGTVCFALAHAGETETRIINVPWQRDAIRRYSCYYALHMLLQQLRA